MNELSLNNVTDVLSEINAAFFDIPFENSDFQTRNFVIAAQLTPERAYRAIGLRLHAKIRTLKDAMYARELEDIDIREMESKLACADEFEAARLRIKIAQKRDALAFSEKLANDALHECSILYTEFKKFPAYTRAEFEAGELAHFEQRLLRQIQGVTGAHESLANMQIDITALESQLLRIGATDVAY